MGYEKTGLVENEKNVWVHPPRTNFFSMLEFNPFPFIMSPYEIGNKWTWSLNIGSQWADKKWKTWDGQITNLYTYEIIDKKVVPTKLGNLECYIVMELQKAELEKQN